MVDDEDRQAYLRRIGLVVHRWDWQIISFALMSSHVHKGALAGVVPPGRYFGPLHTRFASYWHRRHGGLGPVFADRPTNYETQPWRIGRLVAYHHRNPVRAKVVCAPRESRWTSHRMYLRLDPAPSWLDIEHALSLLGFADTEAGRRQFDQFVCDVDLDDFDPSPRIGRDETSEGAANRNERIRAPRSARLSDAQWETLVKMACQLSQISPAELRSRSRQTVSARRLVAAFAYFHLGQPLATIAGRFGVSPVAVHHWLYRDSSLVEELRAGVQLLRGQWDHHEC